MVGKLIRNYEIQSEIGAGGNGVVYRARNLQNDEIVAIKLIGPKALEDSDRLQRFRHEAKIASTLNHPGIVRVFEVGVETINGIPRDFIVMELVEGRTLADRIGGRPMAVTEALSFAIQIAGALAAAHAANIVHRDVKPSNLLVNAFGVVKLADFGLAKRPVDQAAETTSVQLDLTHDGTIVGSVAYMSPEQARGLPLDGRSDIFSFGSVFYEMLAGKPAFSGQTTADKLSAVLTAEPLELLDIPADLWAILVRCLRKDLTRRWQSATELKSALEDFRSSGSGSSTTTVLKATSTRRAWIAAGAGLTAGLLPSAYLLTRDPKVVRFQKLTFRHGDITGARFAPGDLIAYTARWDGEANSLYTCQPGNREGRKVNVPPGTLLGVNPKNEAAVLLDTVNTLSVVALGGGEHRPRLEKVTDACWSPDGSQLAISRQVAEGRFQIEYPPGNVLHVAEGRSPLNLKLSPSGTGLAFFEFDNAGSDFKVTWIDAGKKPRTLSSGWRTTAGLIWNNDGDSIWFCAARSGEDPAVYSNSLTGAERVVFQSPEFLHLHDIHRDGRVLVARAESRLGVRLGSTQSLQEKPFSYLGGSNIWDICDESGMLVFAELNYGQNGNASIFVSDWKGSPARLIGEGTRPAISRDGRRIACLHRENATTQVAILPTGPGDAVVLPQDPKDRPLRVDWLPDGSRILVQCDSGTYLTEAAPGKERKRISAAGVRATLPSPEGDFAVGIEGVKICRYSLRNPQGPIPFADAKDGEQAVRWTQQGIVTKSASDRAWVMDRIHPVTGQRTRLREIVSANVGAILFNPLVVSWSGELYAYTVQEDSASLHLVRGLA